MRRPGPRIEVRTLKRPVNFIHTSHACLYGYGHIGRERVQLQTIPTKLGAWKCLNCLDMLNHSEFLSLELRVQVQLLKTTPHQTWHLAQWSQTNTVVLATTKPRPVHQMARWRSEICDLSTLLALALGRVDAARPWRPIP